MSEDIALVKEARLVTLATEINTIKSTTQRIMMQASIEIGKRLAEAKGAVGHGNWESWLSQNVDYSQRTATNLIKVYEEYGLGQEKIFGEQINPQALADLTYTQAVALLGIKNPDERADFINRNDIGDMSTRELEKAIRERDEARQEKKAAEEALKALDQAVETEKEKTQKAEQAAAENIQKIADEQKKAQEAEQKLQLERVERHRLEDQLKEARQEAENTIDENPDDGRVQELEEKLASAKARIDKLKKEVAGIKDENQAEKEKSMIRAELIEQVKFEQTARSWVTMFNTLIDMAGAEVLKNDRKDRLGKLRKAMTMADDALKEIENECAADSEN
jgi:hypothetical protein